MDTPVRVLDDASSVGAALTPMRRRLVAALGEDGSATSVAARLGLSRQKVNYHLRELEKAGIVQLVETRPRRGFTERIYRLSARRFLVDPSVLGVPPAGPTLRDRFSSAYLVTVAARLVSDVAALRDKAALAGKKLLTQTVETEVRFETPQDFDGFTGELASEISRLVEKYGASTARGGRRYRFVLGAHPALEHPRKDDKETR